MRQALHHCIEEASIPVVLHWVRDPHVVLFRLEHQGIGLGVRHFFKGACLTTFRSVNWRWAERIAGLLVLETEVLGLLAKRILLRMLLGMRRLLGRAPVARVIIKGVRAILRLGVVRLFEFVLSRHDYLFSLNY